MEKEKIFAKEEQQAFFAYFVPEHLRQLFRRGSAGCGQSTAG